MTISSFGKDEKISSVTKSGIELLMLDRENRKIDVFEVFRLGWTHQGRTSIEAKGGPPVAGQRWTNDGPPAPQKTRRPEDQLL